MKEIYKQFKELKLTHIFIGNLSLSIIIGSGAIYLLWSADVGNKHGFNTHGVVFDELHTQPNRKPIKAHKEKSTEKIDGAVATIMALDRAIRCGGGAGGSVYDERGLLVF